MQYIYTLTEIDHIALKILPSIKHKIIILQGEMGMGKTTLIKALVKALGIDDTTVSPTFGIVNQYENNQICVYHFDLYRIENKEEALNIGLDEYLFSDSWCFIEWADKIKSFLPKEITQIRISWLSECERKLEIINS